MLATIPTSTLLRTASRRTDSPSLSTPDVLIRLLGDEATTHLLAVAYSPTIFYDDLSGDIDDDHDARVRYALNGARLDIAVEGGYSRISGNNVRNLADRRSTALLREERRAGSDRFDGSVDLNYDLTGRLDLEAKAGYYDVAFDDALNDYSSWAPTPP